MEVDKSSGPSVAPVWIVRQCVLRFPFVEVNPTIAFPHLDVCHRVNLPKSSLDDSSAIPVRSARLRTVSCRIATLPRAQLS